MSIPRFFIGYDPSEDDAYKVCQHSIKRHCSTDVEITPLVLPELRKAKVFWREHDPLQSTEFTYTRFLVPYLCDYKGWAIFVDCDFLFTADVTELWSYRDHEHAVHVCKHDYTPKKKTKMANNKQTSYPRKNWSSLILFNCAHESNKTLTKDLVSTEHPAFLHRFQWLEDNEIGELPLDWNWLEGEYEKPVPKAIHHTYGGPWFEEWQDVDYADLWYKEKAMIDG